MILENIRLSQEAKEQLIRLKRHTGLGQWNVLCRWALLRSLAEPTDPPDIKIPADSNVEMAWKVFAGRYGPVFEALIVARYRQSGRAGDEHENNLGEYFRQHLHRGIGTFAGDRTTRNITSLVLSKSS